MENDDRARIAKLLACIITTFAQVNSRVHVNVIAHTRGIRFDAHLDRFDDNGEPKQRALGAGVWAEISAVSSRPNAHATTWYVDRCRVASTSLSETPDIMILNASLLTKLSLAVIEVRCLIEEMIRIMNAKPEVMPIVIELARGYSTPKE